MQKLNLPIYNPKLIKENNNILVFDLIRKKYIPFTPEEHVRQCFINFLTNHRGYSVNLMRTEMFINLNGTKKRSDIVIFDKNNNAKIIVECKAPEVNITKDTFDQAIRYNFELKAEYIILTNGIKTYCFRLENGKWEVQSDVPFCN